MVSQIYTFRSAEEDGNDQYGTLRHHVTPRITEHVVTLDAEDVKKHPETVNAHTAPSLASGQVGRCDRSRCAALGTTLVDPQSPQALVVPSRRVVLAPRPNARWGYKGVGCCLPILPTRGRLV
jgi:hypothetical protein